MIIKAFRVRVHPEHVAEYERRHNPIWPELEAVLKAHGVRRYFIFLDETTADLFAYAEIDSESQWQAIARTETPSDADLKGTDHDPRDRQFFLVLRGHTCLDDAIAAPGTARRQRCLMRVIDARGHAPTGLGLTPAACAGRICVATRTC